MGRSPAETLLISAKAQTSVVLQVNIVNVSNSTIVKTVVGLVFLALFVGK